MASQLLTDASFDKYGRWSGYLNVTREEAVTRRLKNTVSQSDLNSFKPSYRPIGGGNGDTHADNVSISFPRAPKQGSDEEGFLNNALKDLKVIIDTKLDQNSARQYYRTETGKGLYEKVLRRIAFIQYFTSK